MFFRYCPQCATGLSEATDHQFCANCGYRKYENPTPVSVMLQPILGPDFKKGLAVARRAIHPCRGEWSLIGGFMQPGESIERGAWREFREETGFEIAMLPRYLCSHPADGGTKFLSFCVSQVIFTEEEFLQGGRPCPENFELGVFYPEDVSRLCFATHVLAAKEYWQI